MDLRRRVTVYSPFQVNQNLMKHGNPSNIYKRVYPLNNGVDVIIKIKEEPDEPKNLTIREVTFSTNTEFNINNLRHQNLVEALEIYKHNGSLYIISELIDISLVQIRCLYTYIGEKQLSSIIKQLLDAILYLASEQRIHPKIELQNVLINKNGLLKLANIECCKTIKSIAAADKQNKKAIAFIMKSLMDKSYEKNTEKDIFLQNKSCAWTETAIFLGSIERLSMQELAEEQFLQIGGKKDLYWLVPYVIRQTPNSISSLYKKAIE